MCWTLLMNGLHMLSSVPSKLKRLHRCAVVCLPLMSHCSSQLAVVLEPSIHNAHSCWCFSDTSAVQELQLTAFMGSQLGLIPLYDCAGSRGAHLSAV